MGDINKQAIINAPARRVFSYVADPRNAPRFISSITSIISGPEGTPTVGRSWRAEANFLGQQRTVNLRLDKLVQDREVRFVMEGDPQATIVLDLSADDGSSERTSVALTLDVAGVPTLLLNVLLGGLLTEDMARLKRNLET